MLFIDLLRKFLEKTEIFLVLCDFDALKKNCTERNVVISRFKNTS